MLIQLTRHELAQHVEFVNDSAFRLVSSPAPANTAIPLGLYELPRRTGEAHLYRAGHPLADLVISRAKSRSLAVASVRFEYGNHEGKVSALCPLVGQAGYRVRSPRGVQFRRWASTVLKEYLLKGFALDDERLKNRDGRPDHFDKMLARIRTAQPQNHVFPRRFPSVMPWSLFSERSGNL